MLIIGTNKEQAEAMSKRYENKFIFVSFDESKSNDNNYIVHFIEQLKNSILQNEITFILYNNLIITLLNKLNIIYSVIKNEDEKLDNLRAETTTYILQNNSYNDTLALYYGWIKSDKKEELIVAEDNSMTIPEDMNKLTFEQLINEDINITEADVRSFNATQNKLKVGMLLQAKNSLNRILKLTNVLDKLYDELVERIDVDLSNTDTASIMYTADYISTALQNTNKLIMDLINNKEMQQFFIIDNSQNINISDDSKAINSRDKIRTAARIVLENLDYFQQGRFEELKNPNVVEVKDTTPNTDISYEDNIIEIQGDNNESST